MSTTAALMSPRKASENGSPAREARGSRAARSTVLTALLWLLGGCGHQRAAAPDLDVVPHVDLRRYLGTWYEIARLPTSFQRDCLESTATYEAMDGGKIRVTNACNSKKSPGETNVARGKAWVVDEETNAKLKVQFFWPFSGDYWILDLGEDYQYAVVGEPSRRYLWVLSRTPTMSGTTYDGIVDKMRRAGFDTDALVVVRPIDRT